MSSGSLINKSCTTVTPHVTKQFMSEVVGIYYTGSKVAVVTTSGFFRFLPSCLWCCVECSSPCCVFYAFLWLWDSDHNGPVKPVSGCHRQLLVVVENQQDVDRFFFSLLSAHSYITTAFFFSANLLFTLTSVSYFLCSETF